MKVTPIRTPVRSPAQAALLLSLLVAFGTQASTPMGTAFTYHGRLAEGSNPAGGSYDFRFTLHAEAGGGVSVAGPITNGAVHVNQGLFTTTIDFGLDAFAGQERWLQLAVRTNGGGTFTALTPRQALTPAPYAIYAQRSGSALTAGWAGTVASDAVPTAGLQHGAVTSEKISDGTISVSDLSSTVLNNTFWRTSGNASTTPGPNFIGTTDGEALELKVNNQRAMRLEPVLGDIAPNVIGGHRSNRVATGVSAATIGGGGGFTTGNVVGGEGGVVGGGLENHALGMAATVSGGQANTAGASGAAIGGGAGNQVSGNANFSTIGGGTRHRIETNASYATISGGDQNRIGPWSVNASIGGGFLNQIGPSAQGALIAGGEEHWLDGTNYYSAIGGGYQNKMRPLAKYSVIAGGEDNVVEQNALYASIGGGNENQVETNALWSTIPGGFRNRAAGEYSMSAGNRAAALHNGSFVWASGSRLLWPEFASTGPEQFLIRAPGGVGIGTNNPAGAALNVAGTVRANAFEGAGPLFSIGGAGDQPLEFKVDGMRALRLEPTGDSVWDSDSLPDGAPNLIGGSPANAVAPGVVGATISGGGATAFYGTPAPNLIGADYATIDGGVDNTIQTAATWSTIGGGGFNTIETYAHGAIIGGGYGNTSETYASFGTIGGGYQNTIEAYASFGTIGGGYQNSIQVGGKHGTIPGGHLNTATNFAFAAGSRAKANHRGAFVWADSTGADFASTAADQFSVRANGGVRIESGIGPGISLNAADRPLITRLHDTFTSGNNLGAGRWGLFMEPHTLALGMPAVGGKTVKVVKYNTDSTFTQLATFDQSGNLTIAGTYYPTSDRAAKENFESVDSLEVLEKVAALPISRWNYKSEPGTAHIGPVSQDFHAAFSTGPDDKHIATVDADGVALAAIQGLSRKVEAGRQKTEARAQEWEARLQELESENAELRRRLDQLERLVKLF